MSPEPNSILSLTIDTRWSHGIFHYGDDDPMTFPFLGWAVQVTAKSQIHGGYDSELVPVFLDEPTPMPLNELIKSYGDEPKLTFERLVPAAELS